MGVPVTFLDKHNPEQFEIMGLTVSAHRYGAAAKTLGGLCLASPVAI